MKNEKTTEYYLQLPYKIEIEPISEEEGGGFTARLSQFGLMGIVGDGETIEEAIDSLNNIKRIAFKRLIDKNVYIPEPEADLKNYSGKFPLRMPKELHAQLTIDARENGVSLNQYLNYLLSSRSNIGLKEILTSIENKIEACVSEIPELIYDKSKLAHNNVIKGKGYNYADNFKKIAA